MKNILISLILLITIPACTSLNSLQEKQGCLVLKGTILASDNIHKTNALIKIFCESDNSYVIYKANKTFTIKLPLSKDYSVFFIKDSCQTKMVAVNTEAHWITQYKFEFNVEMIEMTPTNKVQVARVYYNKRIKEFDYELVNN